MNYYKSNKSNYHHLFALFLALALLGLSAAATAQTEGFSVNVLSGNNTLGATAGDGIYQQGNTAVIFALAKTGGIFAGWADGNTENPRYITIASDTAFTANFAVNPIIAALEAEKVTLNTIIKMLETQVSGLVSDTIMLNKEINSLAGKLDDCSIEKSELETQVSVLKSDTITLNEEINSLAGKLEDCSMEKTELETQVSVLESDTITLNGEINSLTGKLDNCSIEKTGLETQISVLKSDSISSSQEITSLKGKLYDYGIEKTELETEISALESDTVKLSQEIISLKAKLYDCSAEKAGLEIQLAAVDTTLLNREIISLKEKLENCSNEKTGLETLVTVLASDTTKLNNTVTTLNSGLEACNMEKSALQAIVSGLPYAIPEVNHIVAKINPAGTPYILIYPDAPENIAYQWYYNGKPVENATRQFYRPEGGLKEGNYQVHISDMSSNLCGNFTLPYTVGKLKSSSGEWFTIHPNPSGGRFTVTFSNESAAKAATATISLFSLSGNKLRELRASCTGEIELNENLDNGTYLLKVEADSGLLETKQIIVKK